MKKVYINSICSLCMLVNLCFTAAIMSKAGIIRDEYGITGGDDLLTLRGEVFILYLPVIIIVLNLISLAAGKIKKQLAGFIILLSIGAIIISACFTVTINGRLKEYQLKEYQLEEY